MADAPFDSAALMRASGVQTDLANRVKLDRVEQISLTPERVAAMQAQPDRFNEAQVKDVLAAQAKGQQLQSIFIETPMDMNDNGQRQSAATMVDALKEKFAAKGVNVVALTTTVIGPENDGSRESRTGVWIAATPDNVAKMNEIANAQKAQEMKGALEKAAERGALTANKHRSQEAPNAHSEAPGASPELGGGGKANYR